MIKTITLLLAMVLTLTLSAQSRIFKSYESVTTEYFKYDSLPEVTVKITHKTDSVNEYISLIDTVQGKYIVHYFSNGDNADSFVYQTIVYVSDDNKNTMISQVRIINENYYRLDDHNWYIFEKGRTLEVFWVYNFDLEMNIFEFTIRKEIKSK